MVEYNVSRIIDDRSFPIIGVSYIGAPKDNTAMYISKKIADKIGVLRDYQNCLVFAQAGIEVDEAIKKKNAIVFSDNPQLAYARFAMDYVKWHEKAEAKMSYKYVNGSYISESAVIGDDVYIEEGCHIGHNVVIGNDAKLLKGCVIRNARIGDGFIANEYAVVGANGFTMATDEHDNKIRIPSLGGVLIGDNVEIGAHDNVSRGSAGDTILENNVKLDAFVHIGHDACLKKNVEVTAGAIVGGFDIIGENVFLGLNVTLRNRIAIHSDTTIGMGAVVTKNIEVQDTVVGNPAKHFEKSHVAKTI